MANYVVMLEENPPLAWLVDEANETAAIEAAARSRNHTAPGRIYTAYAVGTAFRRRVTFATPGVTLEEVP